MKNRFLRTAASAVLTVLLVLTLLPQRVLAVAPPSPAPPRCCPATRSR